MQLQRKEEEFFSIQGNTKHHINYELAKSSNISEFDVNMIPLNKGFADSHYICCKDLVIAMGTE